MKESDFIEALLERRQIYLDDDIEEGFVEKIIKLLMFLDSKERRKTIFLYINSNGGDVMAGLRLYSFIKHVLISPVTGIVIGEANSMALVVLQACKRRIALKTSRFFLHNLKLKLNKEWNEFLNFAEQELKEIKEMQEEVFRVLGEKGRIETIKEISEKKVMINADQALELGLIDEIIG